MSYNNDNMIDFTKEKHHIEILDNPEHDDIKVEIEIDKSKEFGFLDDSTIKNPESNSSTRPDSLQNNENYNSTKKREENMMISLDEKKEARNLQVSQVKKDDYMSKVVYRPGNSLNEPIIETFKRDLNRIYDKIKYVLKFQKTEAEESKSILDWDLWGPLLLCILLSR